MISENSFPEKKSLAKGYICVVIVIYHLKDVNLIRDHQFNQAYLQDVLYPRGSNPQSTFTHLFIDDMCMQPARQ